MTFSFTITIAYISKFSVRVSAIRYVLKTLYHFRAMCLISLTRYYFSRPQAFDPYF